MDYNCTNCGRRKLVQKSGTWICKGCGYVPPHGSD
ncbi:hypothetical protein DMJ13_22665 [halophilic archaeon]|nr:hypothetical protein DMJ13_22665 [halophilic archaeon]